MVSVLGRIMVAEGSPRGPDVKHKVRVLRRWLERGETIEVELPRNLECASCDGGGCDACHGAGAISLRGRKDPAERVELTLPVVDRQANSAQTVALRIPERGGPGAEPHSRRGLLILTVIGADEPDPSVRKIRPSLLPPSVPAASLVAGGEGRRAPSPSLSWPVVIAVAVTVWVLLALVFRGQGCL